MGRIAILALGLAGMGMGQAWEGRKLDAFQTSRVAALAGAAFDVRSSYGLIERNPLLGAGSFGHRQAAMSMAITGALVYLEGPLVRRHPQLRKPLTVANWFIGGIRFGVGVRNSRMQ